jgi:formylglycine-generating enzyme required for sulfatase activity
LITPADIDRIASKTRGDRGPTRHLGDIVMKRLGIILGVYLSLAFMLAAGCSDKTRDKHGGEPARPNHLTLDLGDGVTMKLTLIPAGKFMMGSPKTELGHEYNEGLQHEVQISDPFYMGFCEVTQAQWRAVMGTAPWGGKAAVRAGDNNAASHINWHDADKFCKKLSARTGRTVVLPTEAQWEYACRAGAKGPYCFGDDQSKLSDYAWYEENALDKNEEYAHATGSKKPNAWGLHDMHGNVWEWCGDGYISYARPAKDKDEEYSFWYETIKKPVAWSLRGGAFDDPVLNCRSAFRGQCNPAARFGFVGFRAAVLLEPDKNNAGQSTKTKPARPARTTTSPAGKTLDLGKGVTMHLSLIPAGKFPSRRSQVDNAGEMKIGAEHEITISKPFYMGSCEVTRSQWLAVMDTNPWKDDIDPDSNRQCAAGRISWYDATRFCEILSKKTGEKVALPTEAQWEYACRAGSKTTFYFGDDKSKLRQHAWYSGFLPSRHKERIQKVGLKKSNAWGLYDMYGNACEWCRDWYDSDFWETADTIDPQNTTENIVHVLRGGSVKDSEGAFGSGYRDYSLNGQYYNNCGFRIMVTPDVDGD